MFNLINLWLFVFVCSFSFLFPLLVFGVVIPAIPVLGGSCRRAGLCCTGRDSACVVQQETPSASLASEGVPRDKPCYCDHACLKLGDCCSDFKHHCGGEYLATPSGWLTNRNSVIKWQLDLNSQVNIMMLITNSNIPTLKH